MTKHTRTSPARYTWLLAPLAALLLLSGCPENKKVKAARGKEGTGTSTEPDKVLYQRALDDIQHNRYDQGRLSLQTLINTYPDSEYLAKAKLATADSYFKQGGSSLTQAIAEYQDFITFFPFLDEAAYAQMQVAMSHYKRMEKPDRDREEAMEAEGAFQTFLQKYPSSPLFKDSQQRLREVQEVLAEGDFAVARFYYLRNADRASATRLLDLVNRYPLFSQADRANWMMATVAQRSEHNDIAGTYYARVVKDYPLSPLAGQAKNQLVRLGVPVPQADPSAMARMQAEQQIPRPREKGGILRVPTEMFSSTPNVSMAARVGEPTMTPENSGAGDTLNPGGNMSVGIAGAGGTATTSAPTAVGAGTGAIVETVVPGSVSPAASGAAAAAAPAPDAIATIATPPSADATGGSDSSASGSTASTDSAAPGDSGAGGTATTAQNTSPASGDTAQNSSTSKKKKGIKKILPF